MISVIDQEVRRPQNALALINNVDKVLITKVVIDTMICEGAANCGGQRPGCQQGSWVAELAAPSISPPSPLPLLPLSLRTSLRRPPNLLHLTHPPRTPAAPPARSSGAPAGCQGWPAPARPRAASRFAGLQPRGTPGPALGPSAAQPEQPQLHACTPPVSQVAKWEGNYAGFWRRGGTHIQGQQKSGSLARERQQWQR